MLMNLFNRKVMNFITFIAEKIKMFKVILITGMLFGLEKEVDFFQPQHKPEVSKTYRVYQVGTELTHPEKATAPCYGWVPTKIIKVSK